MPVHRRIEVTDVGAVAVVRFVDRRILDASRIQELGDELFGLVEREGKKDLLLNFSHVQFLSSGALNKLIVLERHVADGGGRLKLSNLGPEIYEVFLITRLNQLFDIHKDEAEGLASFGQGGD